MNRNSVLAGGVLCVLSVLVIGAVVGVGFASFCVCDEAVAAAFNRGLAPGDDYATPDDYIEEHRLDDDIEQNRLDDNIEEHRINEDVSSGASISYGPPGLWASYFAYSW